MRAAEIDDASSGFPCQYWTTCAFDQDCLTSVAKTPNGYEQRHSKIVEVAWSWNDIFTFGLAFSPHLAGESTNESKYGGCRIEEVI